MDIFGNYLRKNVNKLNVINFKSFEVRKMRFDDIFEVVEENDEYIFLYCNIENKNELLEKYFEYFFEEKVMYQHFNYLYNVPFIPSQENYIKLYYELKKFIDDYNFSIDITCDNIEDIKDVLFDEDLIFLKKSGEFKYRYDKAGKLGEYFFSILLERFFNLHCVIPKTRFITDYNMSVYGIDVIYINDENELFFGESKFTKNIYNGIAQINKSLESYEKQIDDEYELVLNAWDSRHNIYKLHELFGEKLSYSISFRKFINAAKVENIYVPLFISHGTEVEIEKISEQLKRVKRVKLFDLNTKYIVISLPIIDKDEFIKYMSKRIQKRMNEYEQN